MAAVLPRWCSHTPHAAATHNILYIMSRGDHLGQAWSGLAETLHHLPVTNFLTSGTEGRMACTRAAALALILTHRNGLYGSNLAS